MASLEERVATVEAHTDGHSRAIDALRVDMRENFRAVQSEIADLRADMSRRFDMMDQKFVWLVGAQVATLVAVVGAMAATLAAVIYR